jgi:hypothetical protein
VDGRSPEEVHRLLGVKGTGRSGLYGEHPLVGRRLPNGWYIVIADSSDDRIVHKDTLAQLSEGGRAIACSLEEHVMASSCASWEDGEKKWSVEHESERGMFDVKTSGKVPEGFSPLKERLSKEQEADGGEKADVDLLFDLPLELAKQSTGFKHDEEAGDAADGEYEILDAGPMQKVARIVSASKPWVVFLIALLAVGFVLAAAGDLVKWAIKFFSKLVN